ncbi:MAG TPA: hypothetical protein VN641_20095 [Urbifossiella sp.]|nr:hypothetical protein [Urbifossiella sp.]
MIPRIRSGRAVRAAAVLLLAAIGCQPVREDRTIVIGPDGQASFQHGHNGVYVTDPATHRVKRIYEPMPDDLAIGPPQWDASGKKMLFAVAQAADGTRYPQGESPADGLRYPAIPVRYTCWLYRPAAEGRAERLDRLFEAACGHAGAIAAGLALAWHLDSQHIDYIEQSSPDEHHMRTWNLEKSISTDAMLPAAEAIALFTAPGLKQRIAILSGQEPDSGIWIKECQSEWWRLPESAPGICGLDDLQRRGPTWSRDGKRFAYAEGSEVHVVDLATRKATVWHREAEKQQASHLHWHPDGTRIGLLEDSRLVLIGPAEKPRQLGEKPVAAFAGWDQSGKHLAFVRNELPPHLEGFRWATLLVPNLNARTAVCVAKEDGSEERTLVRGIRATFLTWSAVDARLSAWLTVEPPYRIAEPGTGLRNGDPAVLINPENGELTWLPVNGMEEAQIGRFLLQTGQTAAALERFDKAAAALAPQAKADWMFFRAVALEKVGRAADARAAWLRFEPPTEPATPNNLPSAIAARHRFAAEAYLSLDMAKEATAYFDREFAAARSDFARLSAAIVQCQLLLLTDRRDEFAEQVLNRLLSAKSASEAQMRAIAWTVAPLAVTEFLAGCPKEVTRRIMDKAALRPMANDELGFACQLIARSCARKLGERGLLAQANDRIVHHPARLHWPLNPATGEFEADQLNTVWVQSLKTEMILRGLAGVRR